MSKEFMKVYHMPFKAQEIKDDNLTNFRLQFDQAFEEMTKSFSEQQDEIIANYLYEKYKDTKVSDVWVLSKPDFEKFLLEMLPKWKEPKQYVDELKLVEKKLKALDLLMQELDCKDFAELRKYARCGYDKLNKKYLKWEDLKKSNSEEHLKVKLNNVKYELHFEKWAKYDDATRISLFLNEFCVMSIRLRTDYDKQFFNDLHLEVLE